MARNAYRIPDRRNYGPFQGRMHEVSKPMYDQWSRLSSMGMLPQREANPNPERFARTYSSGGLTGSMTPSYVTGGGTVWNPQFEFSGALTPDSYNQWALGYQTSKNPSFDPMSNEGSETVSSNYEISSNPGIALRMGMPINRDAVAESIAARRGGTPTAKDYFRADWRIGNQLYRKNVRGGFAQPGTYARQGGGIPKGSTWGQVSQRGRR